MRNAASIAVLSAACFTLPATAAEPGTVTWEPTWADEFDAAAGATPDATKWIMETGTGNNGWGNNELQTYTDRASNASHDGNGNLVITARRENFTGTDGNPRQYTSARLKTQTLFNQTYGRFESRIKLPQGQGIWPAFWMLGEDIATDGWPNSGEIDIMEFLGQDTDRIYGTIHGPGYSAGDSIGDHYDLPGGGSFADNFHNFAVEWTPGRIEWSVDGEVYQTRTPQDLGGRQWVFNDEFFMLLNVAVGGNWPGSPDATTQFPQQMTVDYVRVSERKVATRTELDNARFREGNSAWDRNGNAYIETHDPSASPSRIAAQGPGDSALKLFGSFNGGPETRVTQKFLEPSALLEQAFAVSLRSNSDDSIAGTDNRVILIADYYDNYDQFLGTDAVIALDGDSPVDEWVLATLEVDALPGTAYIHLSIEFDQPGFEGGAVWVDDAAFLTNAAVPEPAALGLLGISWLALARQR